MPRASGLHLVAACYAHNRQLVSRSRILKYSMYTMIQALEYGQPPGMRLLRGVGQKRPVFQISQNIAHPGRPENGTPGPMSVLPRQFNQRSYRRVVEYVRGVKKRARTASPSRSAAQAEHSERPDKTVQALAHRADRTACGRDGTVTLGSPRGTWHGG